MKIIFLDVDGVLNSKDKTFGHTNMVPYGPEQIEPSCVAALDAVLDQTDAKVVISSSWRHVFDFKRIEAILVKRGLRNRGRIIDATSQDASARGDEIQHWLDLNDEEARLGGGAVTSFVILDDNGDMEHLRDRLYKLDSDTGLTMDDVPHIVALLNAS
jgi:hypothetical protein